MCPICGLISSDHIFKGYHHVCSSCGTSSLVERFIDEDTCEQTKDIELLEAELEELETRRQEITSQLMALKDDRYELWQVDYDVEV